ncbi:hypothetical protein HK096_002333 [Nowakowskiella sp. JEL0078]|nr:hypothetical protein HK096_002333 [Nowakowskiella sp. JEL0078]
MEIFGLLRLKQYMRQNPTKHIKYILFDSSQRNSGSSEAALNQAITIAISFSVVGLFLICISGYLAVRPLRTLVVSMKTVC